jgi:hypothetical protein
LKKRLADVTSEKEELERKYNELVKAQAEALKQAEARKSALRERRKAVIAEIDKYIKGLRAIRDN